MLLGRGASLVIGSCFALIYIIRLSGNASVAFGFLCLSCYMYYIRIYMLVNTRCVLELEFPLAILLIFVIYHHLNYYLLLYFCSDFVIVAIHAKPAGVMLRARGFSEL